jgi:hypothetical protein
MLGGEAPGREMYPGPEREYAGPVWVRDDRGGGWEAIAKNMSPGILYEVHIGEQNIGLMVSNDFAFPTPTEVVHYIPTDLAWTGTLYIQEVGHESQPTVITVSSAPAAPLFGPLSGWQKLFTLRQIGQLVEQSGPMPPFLVHFLPRGPPRPGSAGD